MTNHVMSVGQVAVLVDKASKQDGTYPKHMLFRKKLPGGKVLSTKNPALGKAWLTEAMEETK